MDSQERRKERRKKKKDLIRIAIALGMAALILIVGLSVKNVLGLMLEQNRLKKENAELKEKKVALEHEFEQLKDKNYIEEQARKQLNMVRPDEIIYIIEDEEDKKKK